MVVSKDHHLKYKNQRFKRLPKLVGPSLETSVFTSSFQVVKEPMPFAYYELPYLDWHYRPANVQVENGNHTVEIQGGEILRQELFTHDILVCFFSHTCMSVFYTHISVLLLLLVTKNT